MGLIKAPFCGTPPPSFLFLRLDVCHVYRACSSVGRELLVPILQDGHAVDPPSRPDPWRFAARPRRHALTLINRGPARPLPGPHDYVAADFASRTMRYTGVLVLLFVFFHLLDLTWGRANPDFIHGDPYHNVDASLSRWSVTLFYIVANVALFLHLYHGGWSLFQSLGWSHPRCNQSRRRFARVRGSWSAATSRSLAVLTGVISSEETFAARPRYRRARSVTMTDTPLVSVSTRRRPPVRSPRSGPPTSSTASWSTRPTSAATRSSSSGPAWRAPPPRPRWPSWATR